MDNTAGSQSMNLRAAHFKKSVSIKEQLTASGNFKRVASMDELRQRMKQRGLDLVQRDDDVRHKRKHHRSINAEQEERNKNEFLQQCVAAGLRWGICDPFAAVEQGEQPGTMHQRQAFVFATRFNSHFKESKVVFFNFATRQVVYLTEKDKTASTQPAQTKDLIGSKASCDLVSKVKFQIWFRGDKAPVNHTLFDEAEYHGLPEDDEDNDSVSVQLELDKFEEHSPRDHASNVAHIRTRLNFPIIEVHKGTLKKRGKSHLTFNDRYCRITNGHLLIYRSSKVYYPLDSVCLFGVHVKPKGRSSFKLKGFERSYFFQCESGKERDQWLTAVNMAKVRAVHEWQLTVTHLKTQRRAERALRHARHMHSSKNLKTSHSSSALSRGYSMSLNPNNVDVGYDQWIDDMSAVRSLRGSPSKDSITSITESKEDSVLSLTPSEKLSDKDDGGSEQVAGPQNGPDSHSIPPLRLPKPKFTRGPASARSAKRGGRGGRKSTGGRSSRSRGALSARKPRQKKAETGSSQPRHRKRQASYAGGYAEFQVHAVDMSGIAHAIGFIEVDDNDTLQGFRLKIVAELDNVPQHFVFLRDGVPVGTRQEAKRSIEYVVSDDKIVSLREEPVG